VDAAGRSRPGEGPPRIRRDDDEISLPPEWAANDAGVAAVRAPASTVEVERLHPFRPDVSASDIGQAEPLGLHHRTGRWRQVAEVTVLHLDEPFDVEHHRSCVVTEPGDALVGAGRAVCARGGFELLARPGESQPFMAVTFDVDTPRYVERPEVLAFFLDTYRYLCKAAMSPFDSLNFVRKLREDHWR
jgi:hypothetical protein